MGVYVDDLLVTETSPGAVKHFFREHVILQNKDSGIIINFLGLRMLVEFKVGYRLDQEVKIDILLR